MNMKYIKLLFLLLGFWTSPVYAAWYQVEIIVFENLYANSDGELWYENPGIPARDGSIELVQPGEGTLKDNQDLQEERKLLIPFMILPRERYRMDGIHQVMKSSSEYRPIIHVSWQQPGSSRARPVHIEKMEKTSTGSMVSGNGEPDFIVPPEFELDGTVRIRSSHFLHVDLDLIYFIGSGSNTGVVTKRDMNNKAMFVQEKAEYVRLKETRKIKLNELHYFDHPMFGAILQVTRL